MVNKWWKVSLEPTNHDLRSLALNSWDKMRIIILTLKLSRRLIRNCDVEMSCVKCYTLLNSLRKLTMSRTDLFSPFFFFRL